MRDFYREEDKKTLEHEPQREHGNGEQHGNGEPPKPAQSAASKLAEMHDDVANQLTAVRDADPFLQGSTIEHVQAKPRPLRNVGANLKPSAGVYH